MPPNSRERRSPAISAIRAVPPARRRRGQAFAEYGFYTSDVSLSNLEKRSLRIADHAAIVTESGKFGRRALTRFAALSEIDLLVTDSGLADEDRRKLRRAGLEILKV